MNWIRLLHDLKNVDHTQPHPIIAEYYYFVFSEVAEIALTESKCDVQDL